MGNGSQQICPKLFILRLHGSSFFFQCVSAVFDRQRTFAQNGKQHAVFKGIQRFFRQVDSNHSEHTASGPKCKIKPLCIRVAVRACAGALFVGKAPLSGTAFRRRIKTESAAFFHCVKNLPLSKRTILLWIHDQVPV